MSADKEGQPKEGGTTQPSEAAAKPGVEPKASPSKPVPPKAPMGSVPEPWNSELVKSLRESFPDVSMESLSNLGQHYLILPRESLFPVAMFLKSECGFNMLTDVTAVDYPKREKRFEVIFQLYSFSRNERLRLKVPLAEEESVESVVSIWSTADWLEREVFDMFGIRFAHHPNLKRILLPEEWQGHPLRKDYGITQQDVQWVRENLHIESGQ